MKKRYWVLLTIATLLISGGIYAIHHILPYMIIIPYRVNAEAEKEAGNFAEGIYPADYQLTAKKWQLDVTEETKLIGYEFFTQAQPARGTFILLHGIGGCKEHMLSLASKLTNIGFNAVIYDARAHGESSGQYCTYGKNEVTDLQKILDKLENDSLAKPYAIWGNSLGGAIALQALAQEKRLTLGVIESTFSQLNQIIYDYQKRMIGGIGIRWVSDKVLTIAGEIADFNPDQIQPAQSAKHINQPVFMAHGNQDEHISMAYGKQNFEHLASSQKQFYEVNNGNHFNLWLKGGREYESAILSFINTNIPVLQPQKQEQ